jgi:hypothetical protein
MLLKACYYQWAFEFETVAFNGNDGDSGGKVVINQINGFFCIGKFSRRWNSHVF